MFVSVMVLAVWAGAGTTRAGNLPAARRPTEAGAIVAWGGCVFDSAELATDDFVAIASGDSHNLVLRENGSIVAWGLNRRTAMTSKQ